MNAIKKNEVSMFKVGDYVIYEILGNEVIKYSEWMKSQNQNWIRHATPEEIAAGHRFDSNTGVTVITPSGTSKVKGGMTAFVDMGDDSHIENHVSPNCKVGVK